MLEERYRRIARNLSVDRLKNAGRFALAASVASVPVYAAGNRLGDYLSSGVHYDPHAVCNATPEPLRPLTYDEAVNIVRATDYLENDMGHLDDVLETIRNAKNLDDAKEIASGYIASLGENNIFHPLKNYLNSVQKYVYKTEASEHGWDVDDHEKIEAVIREVVGIASTPKTLMAPVDIDETYFPDDTANGKSNIVRVASLDGNVRVVLNVPLEHFGYGGNETYFAGIIVSRLYSQMCGYTQSNEADNVRAVELAHRLMTDSLTAKDTPLNQGMERLAWMLGKYTGTDPNVILANAKIASIKGSNSHPRKAVSDSVSPLVDVQRMSDATVDADVVDIIQTANGDFPLACKRVIPLNGQQCSINFSAAAIDDEGVTGKKWMGPYVDTIVSWLINEGYAIDHVVTKIQDINLGDQAAKGSLSLTRKATSVPSR